LLGWSIHIRLGSATSILNLMNPALIAALKMAPMNKRNFKVRARWVVLNDALFLGMAAVAYATGGWLAAWPFVAFAAFGTCYVLFRRPTQSHP
jgi:hypothetical protein